MLAADQARERLLFFGAAAAAQADAPPQGNTNAVVDYIEQGVPVDCVDKARRTPPAVPPAAPWLAG